MLALPDLERLRALVGERRIGLPLTDGALRAAGFARFAEHLVTLFAGLDGLAIGVVLDAAIAERVRRPPPRLKLVWTGPEGQGSTARDTGLLVSELFGGARESVLIAGFRFDHGADIFAPLHQVMSERGVRATIFIDIDIKGEEKTAHGAHEYADRAVDFRNCSARSHGECDGPEVLAHQRLATRDPWLGSARSKKCMGSASSKTTIPVG